MTILTANASTYEEGANFVLVHYLITPQHFRPDTDVPDACPPATASKFTFI